SHARTLKYGNRPTTHLFDFHSTEWTRKKAWPQRMRGASERVHEVWSNFCQATRLRCTAMRNNRCLRRSTGFARNSTFTTPDRSPKCVLLSHRQTTKLSPSKNRNWRGRFAKFPARTPSTHRCSRCRSQRSIRSGKPCPNEQPSSNTSPPATKSSRLSFRTTALQSCDACARRRAY